MTTIVAPTIQTARSLTGGAHWIPRWGKHVSQWIHYPGGKSGGDGCAEAAIARAIMEYDPETPERKKNPEWVLVRRIHDPNDPATITDLMDRVSVIARGEHLGVNDDFTSDVGIQVALDQFGLAWSVYYVANDGDVPFAWNRAYQTAMSIIWVDGSQLSGGYQSDGYFAGFGGFGNHIMTWLPNPDGMTPNLVNDPLADVPDERSDVRYPLDMLRGAFYGCWTLPAPESQTLPRWTILSACAGKRWPNPFGAPVNSVLARIPAGSVVLLTGYHTPSWTEIIYQGTKMFVLSKNLKEVA